METANHPTPDELLVEHIWQALEQVPDPEIPFISVVDLGIISKVDICGDGIKITMTPTFSGCPAIQVIRNEIRDKVAAKLEREDVEVLVDFKTQWNSNMISEKGREALKNFGLAPPKKYKDELNVADIADVHCPHCGSENTTMNSPFGSTLCRAIHYCFNCHQSFEQFKPV